MLNWNAKKSLAGLMGLLLAVGVACGDDDENNITTNNTTPNNTTPNNTTPNNTTPNNTTPNNTTPNNTTPNNTTPNNTTPNNQDTALLQVIHNSPDPAAAVVDVYVNDEIFIDDFAFRTGTGFVAVPAGVALDIDVAPGDSTSSEDRLNPDDAFTFTLTADSLTTLVASGVLDPAQFPDNPSGQDIGFNLLPIPDQKLAPADPATIEVKVGHLAPDAPAVDAVAADGTVLVDGAQYGDVTPYLPVPGGNIVTLDILADATGDRVASYQTTGGVSGVTAVALASGFLNPTDPEQPEFALVVFLATEADAPTAQPGIPLPQAARAQVLHNAADPAAATVDIFVNQRLAFNDVPFRAAGPFVTLPSGTPVRVDVALPTAGDNPGDPLDMADSVFNASPEFAPGSTTSVIANGVLDPTMFDGDAAIAFNLFPVPAQEAPAAAGNFEFKVWHGATDVGAVDLVTSTGTLVDDLMYGMATPDFTSLAANEVVNATVTSGDGTTNYAGVLLDVPALGLSGQTGIVAASGFLDPAANQNGPALDIVFFSADGGAAQTLVP